MEALWNRGEASIREIQESFPDDDRPAYTTVQTTVYRLEGKKAVRRVKKISNAVRAGLIVITSGAVFTQTPAPAPGFEVASIKPAEPSTDGKMRVSTGIDPGRVNYRNVSLKDVLQRAYEVRRIQITGPSWLDSDRFDIVAKVPEGVSKDQVSAMLRNKQPSG